MPVAFLLTSLKIKGLSPSINSIKSNVSQLIGIGGKYKIK
jgi:hypothetical protein